MANPDRVPGKHGALPRDPHRYVPLLEHYLKPWEGPLGGTLPPVPGTVDIDRESAVSDWPMYGNDSCGDCVWAGAGHMFAALAVYAGYPEPLFTDQEIVGAYSAVTGYDPNAGPPGSNPTDAGTDPVAALRYLSSTGLTDTTGKVHKVAAFAAFGDPRNTQLMAQALDTFGTVGIAFGATQGYEDAFSQGEPCTWHRGDPVLGGHYVVLQRRAHGGVGILHEITWGADQRITRQYNWHTVMDAYAIASEDWIRANGTSITGLDLQQLCADTADVK